MNNSFPNITPGQISFFLNNYKESHIKDINFLKSKFENHHVGFDSVIDFLSKINLIKIIDKKVLVEEEIVNRFDENYLNINELLLEKLLITPNKYRIEIREFFNKIKFNFKNSTLNIDPKANYIYSNFRNFLTALGLFLFNPIDRSYKLNPEMIYLIVDFIDLKSSISPEALLKIQAEEKLIGDGAELEILNFEKHRIKEFPELMNKIVHMALNNSAAGYDIKSFELPSLNSGKSIPRYIEVKAVSINDYSFYMSSNELNKASLLKEKYYIYLLPVKLNYEFELQKLKIIKNPVSNLFNKEVWNNNIEKYKFSLIKLNEYDS